MAIQVGIAFGLRALRTQASQDTDKWLCWAVTDSFSALSANCSVSISHRAECRVQSADLQTCRDGHFADGVVQHSRRTSLDTYSRFRDAVSRPTEPTLCR